jgi:replicative DNA helicase
MNAARDLSGLQNYSAHRTMKPPAATGALPELPHSNAAERDILGAILFKPENLIEATRMGLLPDHFVHREHGRIFTAMLGLQAEGKPAELVAVTDRLDADSEVNAIGGAAYIASLVDGQYRGAKIDLYISKIINCSILRQALKGAESLKKAALNPENLRQPESVVHRVLAQATALQDHSGLQA